MENERLQQRLRNAKAKAEALDRDQAHRTAYTFPQPAPYVGTSQVRANNISPAQSFAWTLSSSSSASTRSFDTRQFYPGLADAANLAGSNASAAGTGSSITASPSGDPVDPSADHSLPRKKVSFPLTSRVSVVTQISL